METEREIYLYFPLLPPYPLRALYNKSCSSLSLLFSLSLSRINHLIARRARACHRNHEKRNNHHYTRIGIERALAGRQRQTESCAFFSITRGADDDGGVVAAVTQRPQQRLPRETFSRRLRIAIARLKWR